MSPDPRSTASAPEAVTLALTALTMVAFASNSLFGRMGLGHTHIDPASYTLIRLCSGSLVLAALAMARGGSMRGTWRGAAALFGYAAAFSFAYITVPTGTGAVILFAAVQATMILWGLWRGERLSPLQWTGFAIAVTGLLILVAPGLTAPEPVGAALMFGSGIAWGVYSLIGRGAANPLAETAGNFVRAALLALPLLALTPLRWDATGALWAALSGGLTSGLGYALWYRVLPHLSATRAASVQLSVPVLASLAGVAVLSEDLTTRLIVSSIAVLGGLALVIAGRAKARKLP